MIFPPPAHSGGGLQITNSVRTRAAASAYFSRTPAAGNRKTWSLSLWVKRSAMADGQLFVAYVDGTNYTYAAFESDALRWSDADAGANTTLLITTQLFRDPSAWYHLLFVNDTSTASGQTADNRRRIYVNGVQVTSFSSRTNPAADYEGHWNKAVLHKLGVGIATYFDGYLAKNEAVEGFKTGTTTANAADFGETNSDGVWVPKVYTGTYGTNGFHLDFKDAALTAGSNAGLGKDVSGNGNYWTTNNISVTAGVTYDSMVDTPTNNYCVLNSLDKNSWSGGAVVATFSEANLKVTHPDAGVFTITAGTQSAAGGKWYAEFTIGALGSSLYVGIAPAFAGSAKRRMYSTSGQKNDESASGGYGATYTTGDVIGVAIDCDAGTLTFYNNNTTQGIAYTDIASAMPSGGWSFATFGYNGASVQFNAGQRPFTYTPPSGFKSLCTANRTGTITVSGTFTGNAAADGPFVWIGGVPTVLTINGNAVTFGTHADKTAGGFKLRTASASYNASGSNTWTATATMNFGTTSLAPAPAQGNP